MAVDSGAETLKGIITRLLAVSAVTNLVGTRIYSHVPQASIYPFISISIETEPFAAVDFSKTKHMIRVQAFSRASSIKECLQIRGAIIDALDRQEASVSITGVSLVKLILGTLSTAFQEPDGITYQSVVDFEVVTQ